MNSPRATPSAARQPRIIYVEDDDLMGDIVKDLLSEAGYLIGVIGHGTLAYETIAFKKPDLVILDRSLPGMDGIEILRRLRAAPDTYLMPVLMLTATGGEENRRRAGFRRRRLSGQAFRPGDAGRQGS